MTQTSVLTKESLKRRNFEPDDFFKSRTADRLRITNYPQKGEELAILTCLMSTADLMQEVRELLGKPIKINSAYRCLQVNRAIGSADSSQHVLGLACDFTSTFGTPEEVVKFLHSKNVIVDQCFIEKTWVHISRQLPKKVMGKDPNRMMYGYYLPDPKTKRLKFRPL